MMDDKQRWAKQRHGKGLTEKRCSAAKCCSLCLAMEDYDSEEPVLLTASHWHVSNLQGNDVEKEAISIDSFL